VTTTYTVAGINNVGTGPTASVTVFVTPGVSNGSIGFAQSTAVVTAGALTPVSMTVRRSSASASAAAATVSYSCIVATTPSAGVFAPVFTPGPSGTLSLPLAASTATITATIPEFAPGTTGATITCTLSNPQPFGVTLDTATTVIKVVPPVFRVTVTSSVVPAGNSNVSATIIARPQDVGTSTNIYVFALAPQSVVHAAAAKVAPDARFAWKATGDEIAEDASVACVLAQLNSSGQLQAVSAANLQAYASTVLSGQGNAVTVVNGLPTATIGGATFFVGYGADPNSMLNNGVNRGVANIPGSVTCEPRPPQTGWWWNTTEGGRGYSLEASGNRLFFAAYLYDITGRATWTIAAGTTSLDGSLFVGKLESYAGGQALFDNYRSPGPVAYIGDVTLAFNSAGQGSLIWPGGTVAIERFNIIPNGLTAIPTALQPENGWWWNPQEGGRGYFLEWQGNTLFMAGYMYDASGNPLWYLSSANSNNIQAYANTWWQYANGQTLTGTFKPAQQINANVAPVTIQFQGPETGLMTLPGNKTITIRRYRF
jgi:hypothetical protein